MTIFSDNPHGRRMERLMMTVPNFAPRGVGFRFTEAQLFITTTAATPTEILTATMRQIRCPPFRKRFNEYIESEENPMTYINEKHRARFTLAAKNIAKANYALLSALYLLTADQRLWSCCKHHINNGCVFFENIKLNNGSHRLLGFASPVLEIGSGQPDGESSAVYLEGQAAALIIARQAAVGGIFCRIGRQTIFQVGVVSTDVDCAAGFVEPYLGQLVFLLDSCNHFEFHLISDRI